MEVLIIMNYEEYSSSEIPKTVLLAPPGVESENLFFAWYRKKHPEHAHWTDLQIALDCHYGWALRDVQTLELP